MKPESPIAEKPTARDLVATPDFEPMYALSEKDYQAVIHRLAGLLVTTIQRHRDDGQTDRAVALAEQAYAVLLSYDDDMAELVRAAARIDGDEEGLGQAREESFW